MGDPVPVSLGKGSRKSKFGLEGIAKWKNAYLEDKGDGAKTGFSARAINGSEQWATLTNGTGVRKMLDLDNQILAVAGRHLFSIGVGGGTGTSIGGIPSDGFVTMERNRAIPDPHVMIVCDGAWYIYQSGSLTEGTDPDLPPPIFVIAHKGYFIAGIADGRWFLIGPDSIDVDGLLFAEAESNADGLVMGAVRGPDVILFGTKSADIYNDTGAADFPYTPTMALNMGCWAAGTVHKIIAQVNNRLVDTVIWAATDNQGAFAGVYMLDGFTPSKISDGEVDRLIRDEPDKTSLRCMVWTDASAEDQRSFYTLSGTSFTKTFDTRTGEWHDRETFGSDRWQYSCCVHFNGQIIYGSAESNTLHRADPDLLNENDDPINYVITMPTIHMFPFKFRVNGLYVDALTGVGAVSTNEANADPKLLISYSRDGGVSFSTERQASLGRAGQRQTRIKERSFGIFNQNGVAFRLACSADVVKGIQGVSIDADKLAA